MLYKFKHIFLVALLIILFSGCEKKIHSLKEFNEWINNTDHGYKISKSVNGVIVTMIYTPPEYIALKKMETNGLTGKITYDSLLKENELSAAFIMVFGPDESEGNTNDIMYDGLKTFKEYAERALTLNFDMENKVELRINQLSYAPVLSSLENTYGLSKDRKVNLVFAPQSVKTELAAATDFDVVYSDETFGLGILHFYFNKKEIARHLPLIAL